MIDEKFENLEQLILGIGYLIKAETESVTKESENYGLKSGQSSSICL